MSIRCFCVLAAYVAAVVWCDHASFAADKLSAQQTPQFRRPVAMVLGHDGRLLFVANRRSGSVSTVDVKSREVADEIVVGKKLAWLTVAGNSQTLLAVDDAAHELIVLQSKQAELQVAARLKVARYPVEVVAASNGMKCYISSLWSRQLTVVDLTQRHAPRIVKVVSLPFAPRKLQWLRSGKTLLVTDSFGGRLAVFDASSESVLAVREFNGHNVRGTALSVDGRRLLMAHQILDSEKSTTHDGVHWGGVMLNVLRSLAVNELVKAGAVTIDDSGLGYLGIPDRAAGDPADVVVASDGTRIVAFAGVNEIVVSGDGINFAERLPVGRRPTELTLSSDERHVYVANTFDDSISIVQLRPLQLLGTMSLGPRPQLTAADRGEMLFYDARLASDGWYSCNACHTDGHTNGLLNDNLGDRTYGAPKRVLTLLGTRDTGPWAWNGRATKLESQIRTSVEVTMQGPVLKDEQIEQIAAYVRSLSAAPSVAKARGRIDPISVIRGRKVFTRIGCGECHRSPVYTTPAAYDVGLSDKLGNTEFNPPSLRGVSQRTRYFHDNRAGSLPEIFTRFRHGHKERLLPAELADLVAFLNSL